MLEVLYHHAKFGRARISPAAGAAKNVCLSVCHAFERQRLCAHFAMKALKYRNDFDTVGKEKVCSCAPVFKFLGLMPIGDITKCGSPKTAKLGFFTNRGRQNKPIDINFGT